MTDNPDNFQQSSYDQIYKDFLTKFLQVYIVDI